MTIRKGEPWERPIEPGDVDAPRFSDDAALAAAVAGGVDTARVAGGDLLRTLGLIDVARAEPQRFAMDLCLARLDDGPELPFVAHAIARRRWWRGEFAAIMNAAWLGELYLGPRAHPNDGLVDITVGVLGWQQRLQARDRARSGSHLPHPDLATRRVPQWRHEFTRSTPIRLDGRSQGSATVIEVRVVADAFVLIA